MLSASAMHSLFARKPASLLVLLGVCAACGSDKSMSAHANVRSPAQPVYASPDAALPVLSPAKSNAPAGELVRGEPIDDLGIRFVVEAALRRQELPGCVVAIGDHDGLRYLQAFGERTHGEPMTTDTRFDLASLTKPIATAASLMLLSERGVIDLSAPARNYLRELNVADKQHITIEQLLLHTSGLPKVNPLSATEQGRAHARKSIAQEVLLTRPGAAFEYSDLGYIMLGELVESVTGQDLATFSASQLFAPLAMSSTHFRPAPADARLYAPTELREDVLIRGEVDDPRAYRLGGVAGHAGLFSTAYDLARFAQMLLRKGELSGVRLLSEQTVERFTVRHRAGGAQRTLGFDVLSTYALGRGRSMSERAFGHGGYTGTSLWIDPEQDLFVLLLSNRVHVGPKGSIHPLASAIADLAVNALRPKPSTMQLGVDVLESEAFARLRGRSVALLSHLPARDANGVSTVELLARANGVALKTILSPEHGLAGQAEGHIANSALHGVTVHSLFGRTRKPTAQMLAGVDTVVIDLVDVGTRFYTYMASALKVLETAAELKLPVVLLDRPNPLDGLHVEGPLAEASYQSFVNYHPLPLRHGMTAGELARFLVQERGLDVALHVVQVRGWRRSQWFAATGLTWHPPSPNLHTPEQALLYPAVGLIEGTNLSVGRGSEHAFRVVGAPFIEGEKLAAALRAHELGPVTVTATKFRPRVGPYAGELLPGVAFSVQDPSQYSATHTGLALAASLRALYPEAWDIQRLPLLLANGATAGLLTSGATLANLEQTAARSLDPFRARRARILLYPE